MTTEILDSNLDGQISNKRRRSLLPLWIKIFIWIFLVMGSIAPIGLIVGMFGIKFQLSLYGLETVNPLSFVGLGLICIFLFKGITAYGLWFEKQWAIIVGQIDAIIGILICAFVMMILPFIDTHLGFKLNIRLELVLLIPYLVKLEKIKKEW